METQLFDSNKVNLNVTNITNKFRESTQQSQGESTQKLDPYGLPQVKEISLKPSINFDNALTSIRENNNNLNQDKDFSMNPNFISRITHPKAGGDILANSQIDSKLEINKQDFESKLFTKLHNKEHQNLSNQETQEQSFYKQPMKKASEMSKGEFTDMLERFRTKSNENSKSNTLTQKMSVR